MASPKRTFSQQAMACVVALVIVVAVGWMLARTGGWMNKGYGIAFFVATALVTGIVFWTLTPAPSSASVWTSPGVRLGGGAAIGLVFALTAWQKIPDDGTFVIVPIPSYIEGDVKVRADEGVRSAELLPASRRLVVELEPRRSEGFIRMNWLHNETPPVLSRRFRVERKGVLVDAAR